MRESKFTENLESAIRANRIYPAVYQEYPEGMKKWSAVEKIKLINIINDLFLSNKPDQFHENIVHCTNRNLKECFYQIHLLYSKGFITLDNGNGFFLIGKQMTNDF